MDFEEKCSLVEKCLPESPFKEQIKTLHKEMIGCISWQPIETAPMDCAILVFQRMSGSIWLIAPAYFYVDSWLLMQYHNDNTEYAVYPTHWMPLPAPPIDV